jgi:hypothetical protein
MGPQPASIAYRENGFGGGVSSMVVVNKDSDPLQTPTNPNYVTFRASATGVLTFNQGSTLTLPANSSPSAAMMRYRTTAAGFVGVEFMAGTLSSYSGTPNGALTVVNSLTLPNPTPLGVGAIMHPMRRGLYVTLPVDHAVGVYSYDTTGTLSFVRTVANQGLAICWISMDAAATRLYTSETASGTISVYDITNPSNPVQLQHIAVQGTAPLPAHSIVDPTGKFLYVLDRNGLLHVFDILSDGTVAENHTPYNLGLPAKTVPLGLAVVMK